MESWKTVYSRTYQCLKSLYLNSLFVQTELLEKDWEESYSSRGFCKAWLKEFCTIRMRGPRRSGHSLSLIKLIKKYDLSGSIICPNLHMSKRIKESFGKTDKVVFSSIISIERNNSPWLELQGEFAPNFIAFDVASISKDNAIELIYDCALIVFDKNSMSYKKPFFVFLIE